MRSLKELAAWWDPAMLPGLDYRSLPMRWPDSKVGAHGVPFGHHGGWCGDPLWAERIQRAGLTSMVIINDGDSVRQKTNGVTPVEFLLDNGCVPIIRDAMKFGRGFQHSEIVEWSTGIYHSYGYEFSMWIPGNEPLDPREWPGNERPPREEALEIIGRDLREAAKQIIHAGGLFGLPDGPSWSENPFRWFAGMADRWIFDDGYGFYVGHHYGKGRDRNYPYDDATQKGTPLTAEQYREMLDDFWLDRNWMEIWVQKKINGVPQWNDDGSPMCDEEWTIKMSLDFINLARAMYADPGRNAVGDDVCWRGYERVIAYAIDALGYVPPMMVGEGGWCPRDRPGSGGDLDPRMPYTTLRSVARHTEAVMFDEWNPFFTICPWILGDDSMVTNGYVGWPHDAWVGWAWMDDGYEYEKPVFERLVKRHTDPLPQPDVDKALGHLYGAVNHFHPLLSELDSAAGVLGG